MRQIRPILVIALLAGLSLCAYWVVNAQEGRPLFAPPPVLPVQEPKAAPKYTSQTLPLNGKKPADATLIIPAAAYEVPRPVKSDLKLPLPELIQTGGVIMPPPMPELEPKEIKAPAPPALPALETKPMPLPAVAPEPIKALIVDPSLKEVVRPTAPPILEIPGQIPFPPPSVVAPSPIVPRPTVALPNPLEVSNERRVRSFVPVRPASYQPAPPLAPIEVPLRPAPPVAPPSSGALANLQTPSIAVEKRGPATLRGGDAQAYQIIVRNLGPGAAQNLRIEDDLPAGVRIVTADPPPALNGQRALWTLPNLPAGTEQTLKVLLQATVDVDSLQRVTAQVIGATDTTTVTTLRPRPAGAALTVQAVAPAAVLVGKPAVFEIRVTNQSAQPISGAILFGKFPVGLDHPALDDNREIKGEVNAVIQPGETKTLRMPTTVTKPGRHTLGVRVTAAGGLEASATAQVEVGAETSTLQLRQAPTTRMFLGRDGDLRIEVTNSTSKQLRNIAIADRLPEGLDFVLASDRGLYQANSRTVHWLIDQLASGETKSLIVRVHGEKAGQLQNVVQARADSLGEMNSVGVIQLEGLADLTLRVANQFSLLEVGRETVCDIQVVNPGSAPATNVQIQVQLPAGLAFKNAQGNTAVRKDGATIVFEPIASLAAQSQATYRVTVTAQTTGDQRVRVAVVSDQVRVPVQREVSTMVVPP